MLRSFLRNKPFRIQYAGNLGVDSQKIPFKKLLAPQVDNLALLGNIGRPDHPRTKDFIQFCAEGWKKTYWILGPHELSNAKGSKESFYKKIEQCQNLAASTEGKVVMVLQSEIPIHDSPITILGMSLWSPFQASHKQHPELTQIFCKAGKTCPPEKYREWFLEDMLFYKEKIQAQETFVVLSHHLPLFNLVGRSLSSETYERIMIDANNLQRHFRPNVVAWLSGATGSCSSGNFGKNPGQQTFCSVNSCFEYPFLEEMKPNPGYRNDMYYEIDLAKKNRPGMGGGMSLIRSNLSLGVL